MPDDDIELRVEVLETSNRVLTISPSSAHPPKPSTVCIECSSEDIKPFASALPFSIADGTWGRICNVCYASWGVSKIPALGWGPSFCTFHNTSAAVKALLAE